MNDDYLWDRTGRDPEVEGLERLLAPAALGARKRRSRGARIGWIAGLAAAALFALGALQVLVRHAPAEDRWVAVGDGYRRLDLGRYGHVVAEPDARVRILRSDENLQSLRLDRGTIHASITRAARPRLFQVETPGATCVDLGCKYTLSVDASGNSRVQVQTGRVVFDHGRRQVFIPEGASARAVPGRAPFTPIYDDAPVALREAVENFDAAAVGSRAREAKTVASLVRKREDGLVAWHLLQDPEEAVVKAAHEALVRLTQFGECGIPAAGASDDVREWRNRLFPEWSTWD